MKSTVKIMALGIIAGVAVTSQSVAHGDKHKHEPVPPPAEAKTAAQHLIQVESGFRIQGPSVIRLKRGDQVEVDFISDSADELHLHGYDITVLLSPNQVARLSFKAKHAGRFSYELHKNDREIGAFEIHP